MDLVKFPINSLKLRINTQFCSKEPWQVVTITASTVFLSVWLYEFIFQDESIVDRSKRVAFRLLRRIPAIRKKIDNELKSINESFERDVEKRTKDLLYINNLPGNGFQKDKIMKILNENLNLSDYDWKAGCASGAVYSYDEKLISIVSEVYGKTSYTNPLHPDLFPGLCKMEAEIVRIVCNLFHGDENSCGSMTSGGTESILMACKAYRDYGREIKGIKYPEMVVPSTIHSAFDKASQYLKLKVRSIPVDPTTYQVDIKAMRQAITSSAPNFPYGTMDDIKAISELGLKYNIPVHVDSCLGGFLTCFMEDAGFPIPICDFRLPGVTSISADTHKYGYAPKGTSLVLYREKKYRHHQYTVTTDWPGGVYGSPTVSGSRAGGNIAVCWASLLYYGLEGYVKATRDIIYCTNYIEKG
ncbi:unnamed protein product [Brassicogethes aeneus]|uniref:sphinganine-1-phosphate aldolase n=1 Tax=Brassicogethes aeneus TaxID=1431903 RepID=A0A9P0FIY8_BRAAE|nr:unnamed protein product [Brassicogethes aeneus]